MKKKQLKMDNRPNYYKGQLLLKEDFFAEQSYHINARRRHNLRLHGSGVVSGLEVHCRNDTSVSVQPGYAIDTNGQEIFLERIEEIDLSEFGSNDVVNVSLIYQEGESTEGVAKNSVVETNVIATYVVILTATAKTDSSGVLLARVKLDSQKKVGVDAIDYSETRYASTILAPGSVGTTELTPELKTGWFRLPFHPKALPEGEDDSPPPPSFKIGPTEAVSPKKDGRDLGAAGSMHIMVPMSVNKIIKFRIAGSRNDDKITFRLILGGWDPKKMKHVSTVLKEETISGSPSFLQTYDVGASIDPEYSTLSLWLRCTKRAAISLIAVEVGY